MPPKQQQQTPARVRRSTNPITGILNVSGEPDSGKTWFALSSGAQPERIAFIDDDLKGEAIKDEVEASGHQFGYYASLIKDAKKMREIDFHNHCLNILADLEENYHGKLDVLVWDTWTRFENTFHPFVVSNPNKFRQFYSPMGQIKGAEQWNASFEYEAVVLSMLTGIAPLVILTSHLKKNASKVEIAEGKKPLIQKSRMRVYLRHSSDSPEPTGLLLKRLSKADISSGGLKPINVTHRKVHPFTWERLIHYWNNPVGNITPGPDEQLNEFELSILDGILTKDQKDVLAMARIEAEKEREEEERQRKEQQRFLAKKKGASNDGVPSNPGKLFIQAMMEFGLDNDGVEEVLGVDTDSIMEFDKEEVADAWAKIRKSSKAAGPIQK